MSYKVVLAHPGKQHSYHFAIALEKSGNLYQYVTTVYDKEKIGFTRIVKQFLGKRNRQRANGRKIAEIPDARVKQFCELRALLLLLILRLDKSRKFFDWYNQRLSNLFGKKVAKYAIKHKVDAVIAYDSNAYACFKYLKKKAPHIVRIIDNAAANRYTLFHLYQDMNEKYGVLKDEKIFKSYLVDETKAQYYKKEALLADYHIVASTFSKNTITALGISEDKIFVVPYGINQPDNLSLKVCENKNKLKFLFVGEVSPQKGILQYLEIAKAFSNRAEFHLVGGGIEKLGQEIRQDIESNIIYHGYLLQSELFSLYQASDVLIFPTLNDGFGFVLLEAMAFGLPVIASKNSLGEDVIKDGINGFCVDAGDEKSFMEKVAYFIDNTDAVETFGRAAKIEAQNYTWERYYKEIAVCIEEIIGGRISGE